MSKRKTVSQPNIDGHSYAVLEQQGEENSFRFKARQKLKESGAHTLGDLIVIIGTDEEINGELGSNVTSISEKEKFERMLDKKVDERFDGINSIYFNFREENPYIEELTYNDRHGGEIYAIVNEIKDFVKEHKIAEKDLPHLTEKLQKSAEDKGLKLEIRNIEELKKSYGGWGFILDITRIGEEKINL